MEKTPENSINQRMAVISTLAKRLIQRVIVSAGLTITPDQWSVLSYMWHKDGLSIGKIAEYSKKEFSNITRIVEKLERNGYVEKRRNEADSRSWQVYLLPKAYTIRDVVTSLQRQTMQQSLKGISEEHQRVMLEAFEKMESNIMEQMDRLEKV